MSANMPSYCAECGVRLEEVRPGKHQHPECSQSPDVVYAERVTEVVHDLLQLIEVGLTFEDGATRKVCWQAWVNVDDPAKANCDAILRKAHAALAKNPREARQAAPGACAGDQRDEGTPSGGTEKPLGQNALSVVLTYERAKAAVDALEPYPNLQAILEGRVSGRVVEWIGLKPELERLALWLSEAGSVHRPSVGESLVERLRKRAAIRRQIDTRKSVQEGKPDRLADLLDEAAAAIEARSSQVCVFSDEELVRLLRMGEHPGTLCYEAANRIEECRRMVREQCHTHGAVSSRAFGPDFDGKTNGPVSVECYHLTPCMEGRPIEPELRCATCPANTGNVQGR